MGRYLIKQIFYYCFLVFCLILLFSFLEFNFPGNYFDDEINRFDQGTSSSSYLDILYQYKKSFFLDSDLRSSSFHGASVSRILIPAFHRTLSLFLVTVIFSVTFILFIIWITAVGGSYIAQKVLVASDFVLSIPLIFLVPLFVLLIPGLREGSASDFLRMLIGGIFLSIRFTAVSVQILIHSIQRLRIEPFSRTWIAMGGNQINLIFYWLRGLILAPWVQVLPGFLVQTLTGSILIETLFSYRGLGVLFIQSLYSRDWAVIRPYLIWTSILFFCFQMVADLCQRFFDPRVQSHANH